MHQSDQANEASQTWSFPDDDVREAVAAMLARGERLRVEDAPWETFGHAYGNAENVPALLADLRNPDPAQAEMALTQLWNQIRHQGGSSTAAALAVPFLIRLAADPTVRLRGEALLLAAEAARRNHFGRDDRTDLLRAADPPDLVRYDNQGYQANWTIEAARTALAAESPTLIRLLNDDQAHIRINAAYALAAASPLPPAALAELHERLRHEETPVVRMSLILAVTQLLLEHDRGTEASAWNAERWTRRTGALTDRFAAGLGWLCATTDPAAPQLLALLEQAVADPEIAAAMAELPWPDDIDFYGGLANWVVTLLGQPLPPRVQLVTALAASSQAQVSVSAGRSAFELAQAFRSPTPKMMEVLAGQLTHPDRMVRVATAQFLARAGSAPSIVGDHLAAALDHDDPELRAWAGLALAHCGDPRAVPELVDLLGRPANPWASADRRPPQRILDQLRPHAQMLLPAVCRCLERADPGWRAVRSDLLRGLGTWGSAAAGAVDVLISALTQAAPTDLSVLATALARIGPDAAKAAGLLQDLAATHLDQQPDLIWAHWKIAGGDGSLTAAVLGLWAIIPLHGLQALKYLADIGPGAAAEAGIVRDVITGKVRTWYAERLEAAHALWRITGDVKASLPTLLDLLGDPHTTNFGFTTTLTAAAYLGELGPAAAAATPQLTAWLAGDDRALGAFGPHDAISWDQHYQQTLTTTLLRIGHSQ